MTRKDYVLIAENFRLAKKVASPLYESQDAIDLAACQVANGLGQDNPRFDRERFLTACGVDQ